MSGKTGRGDSDSQSLSVPDFVRKWATTPGPWLIFGSVVLAVLTVVVGTADTKPGHEPNRLATSLLQAITLVFGTWGSFVLGKDASREAALGQVRQHAKSAFRRVLTLYKALGRLKAQAETEMAFLEGKQDPVTGAVSLDLAHMGLDKLRLMSLEHIATGEDALEDWRDLAPDEVARIQAQAAYTEEDNMASDETEVVL